MSGLASSQERLCISHIRENTKIFLFDTNTDAQPRQRQSIVSIPLSAYRRPHVPEFEIFVGFHRLAGSLSSFGVAPVW